MTLVLPGAYKGSSSRGTSQAMECLLLIGGGGGNSSSKESSENRSSSDWVLKSVEFLVEKSEFLVENMSEYRSSEHRSEVGAENLSLESVRVGKENETKSRFRIENGSEVGTETRSLELALATAIEKSEWNRSLLVEFALEKSEEPQVARMENLSTLTELERGIEDLSDSEFLEKRPSLESESFLRRPFCSDCSWFISNRSSTLLDFMISLL